MAGNLGKVAAEFRDREKRKLLAIFRQSAQELAEEANTPEANGGRLPVDTGNLMNSQRASTQGMPAESSQPVALALVSVELGQTVWIGWTAAYAMRQEHGFFGEDALGRVYAQPGKGFAHAAAQNWDVIVDRVTGDVRRRFG